MSSDNPINQDSKITAKQRLAIPRQKMPQRDGAERSRDFKEVNLGLTPLISITGRVTASDPNAGKRRITEPNAAVVSATVLPPKDANDTSKGPNAPKPISGVRVYLSTPQSDRLVTDSVTGDDGSYYLGDVKPGVYVLRVDPKTLAKQYELAEQERQIEVKATKEEFLEITQPDLVATIRPEEKKPGAAPAEGKAKAKKESKTQEEPKTGKDVKADPNQPSTAPPPEKAEKDVKTDPNRPAP